ncbi:PREDICTED: bifunctional epoxide hydrolase 2-like isoform X1 [Nelumbo nucifera]|uniref:soluble epoxide hydrolase n=1 Tax=Nelumbo nucifera TaxID=4432 RepID=A0A1U7ZRP5_NELNU|nr:PREDICTED: bifunctional epoxide hydrolase 2-like isoform X1 [Nelumbo nucifera]
MSDLRQRRVRTNGIWMNIAEKGRGPLVLLLHGFPQLWFSWNYQITQLAKHGYRVVAPDMRGYGDTDAPPDPASYTVIHLVGDIIGLLDELGEERAFVVGHDWGAEVAWYLSLFRPDRVRAVVSLGVPFRPYVAVKPMEMITKMYGAGFFLSQFQEPGRAEKAFSRYDCLTVMKKFLLIDAPDHETAPPGVEFIDFLDTPISLPPWITEEELIFSASKFRKSGFTGPLNYFRAMDLNWEFLKPWQGAKITVPAKLIIGDKDVWFHTFGTKEYMEKGAYKNFVPNLEVVFIDGHRHIQQEKAEEVTHEILSFFNDPSLM